MHISVTFKTIAFALCAAAFPAEKPREAIRIPISQGSDFVNADGTADLDLLRAHASYTTAKLNKRLATFERNTARRLPSVGSDPAEKQGVGSAPMQIVNQGTIWQGQIEVGNPPVKFNLDFDTGISDFFIPGFNCQGCKNHTAYNPESSKSSENLEKEFHWRNVDGSTVNGTLYADDVNIGGLTAFKQTFGAAANVSDNYWLYIVSTDGIMGLGFPEISTFNTRPVFHTLIDQGQVAEPVFAFKIANNGSELMLGGVNENLFQGPFYYSPLTAEGLWQLDMDYMLINGEKMLGKTTVTVESGVRLIVGETELVKDIMSKVPGVRDGSSVGPGFYIVPCNSTTTVTLSFNGKSWDIPPQTFNLAKIPSNPTDCLAGISGAPISPNSWIVGNVFMRSVYTVFDVGAKRIGFAEYA